MGLKIFKTKQFYIAAITTLIAALLGRYLSSFPILKVVGAMVISLLLGMIINVIKPFKKQLGKSVGFISNKFLRLGIILLGFKLNLNILLGSGVKTITLAIFVVTVTIILTYTLAKCMKVNEELALLTAGGCGICGAAAVMGISPQVKAKSDDAVLAVAVVCILGTIFTLLEILLIPVLGLSIKQFGILNGASLHEIAHALAAAGALGSEAVDNALIMKLSRVLLLAPASIIIGFYYKKNNKESKLNTKLPIPWFMLGFLISSAIGTLLVITFGKDIIFFLDKVVTIGYIFLGMAMCALGISVNFSVIRERGTKIFAAASISSIILFIIAYCSIKLFF